jgi:toxin-antitoxin system PIN domain toxin
VIALLDINMLIALFDAAHVHHKSAHQWISKNRSAGWATCPITQNGCARVMSQPNYPGHLSVMEIVRRLSAAISAVDHVFWSDSISLCDASHFEPTRILTANALTDIYLLGLAVERGGRLVTFDRTIPRSAVLGAKSKHLLVL